MAKILLGVTGSVAAMRTPALTTALAEHHEVQVVATDPALYFFSPDQVPTKVIRDSDEWPGIAYDRGTPVMHIELRKWADLFLIAPIDANTLAKIAVGLCDNCLTCVWRAWDPARPIILAPAMNTLMWEHPFTRKHLRSLAADFGAGHIPGHLELTPLIDQINDRAKGFRIVPPITKTLACGDVGVGAMAEVPTIVTAINDLLRSLANPA